MILCTNGKARLSLHQLPPCTHEAVKFYHDPGTGFMFATCQKCLGKKDIEKGYVKISRDEFIVRSVMES